MATKEIFMCIYLDCNYTGWTSRHTVSSNYCQITTICTQERYPHAKTNNCYFVFIFLRVLYVIQQISVSFHFSRYLYLRSKVSLLFAQTRVKHKGLLSACKFPMLGLSLFSARGNGPKSTAPAQCGLIDATCVKFR